MGGSVGLGSSSFSQPLETPVLEMVTGQSGRNVSIPRSVPTRPCTPIAPDLIYPRPCHTGRSPGPCASALAGGQPTGVSVKARPQTHVLVQRGRAARADVGFSCGHLLSPDHETSHLCVRSKRRAQGGRWAVGWGPLG